MKIEKVVFVANHPDLSPQRSGDMKGTFTSREYTLTLDSALRVVKVAREGSARSFIVSLDRVERIEFTQEPPPDKKK